METKDNQVLYSYKNVWARNDSHGLQGKKNKIMTNIARIVHGHRAFRFFFFTQETMKVIPEQNILGKK